MRVLVACEFSQIVTKAFRDKGHEAYSCDFEDCLINKDWHIQDDVLNHLNDNWDLLIGHPTCTFLTNSGVRHLSDISSKNGVKAKIHGKARELEMIKGCEFFNKLKNCNISKICLENPVPHGYAVGYIGMYNQLIQPWMFGHKESKGICLWLKNLPLLKPTKIVGPPPKNMRKEDKKIWHRIHYMGNNKGDRAKQRSVFFEGIAQCMADTWG